MKYPASGVGSHDNAAMGKTYERIDGRLRAFIEEQHIFFTATAPLDGDGTVNLSPKGVSGSFAVVDERTVAYLDFMRQQRRDRRPSPGERAHHADVVRLPGAAQHRPCARAR